MALQYNYKKTYQKKPAAVARGLERSPCIACGSQENPYCSMTAEDTPFTSNGDVSVSEIFSSGTGKKQENNENKLSLIVY